MGVSRGALTFTRLFVQGRPPRDLRKRYLDAVRLRKFTPLTAEDEASEAVGWCVIERPFDLDFEADRIFYDRFLQLGLRVDKWKIPGVLLHSQVGDEEQRMLSRAGREKLTRAEKEDIKLRVIGRLRRKILPTSRAFDVLWDLDAGTVLLFTHSQRTTDELMALFQKTFGLELVADSPHACAGRAQLPVALQKAFEKVEPLSFSEGRKAKDGAKRPSPPPASPRSKASDDDADAEADEHDDLLERIETTRFLGAQPNPQQELCAELFTEPVAARLVVRRAERDFAFDFNATRFLLGSGAVPALLKEEGDDAFLERTTLIEELTAVLDALFAAFLRERLVPSWAKGWQPALMAWVEGESVPASVLKELAAATRAARRSA